MLLVLNVMENDELSRSFDRAIQKVLGPEPIQIDFFRVNHAKKAPDVNKYSHFILSGSEASAGADNPWDTLFEDTLRRIIQLERPLLGICYGHQFLARILLGTQHVRKSETPEFGYVPVELSQDDLFSGITNPLFMVSHYDEVFDLNDDFNIIARSERCAVHGFRYKDLPVWGLQFHPEYHREEADEIFQKVSEKDPNLPSYMFNNPPDEERLEQSYRVLKNFIKI